MAHPENVEIQVAALIVGSLANGFELQAIMEMAGAEEAAIKLLAEGKMAEAILIQDPHDLCKEYNAEKNGSFVVAFGSFDGVTMYGPFVDWDVANDFAEACRGDDIEFRVFLLCESSTLVTKQIDTPELLNHLQKTYPHLGFEMVSHEGVSAIGFVDMGVFICDPALSSCGRFERPDHYGISEKDARKMLANNKAYKALMLE